MSLAQRLGYGKDGMVWATTDQTAVKVFMRAESYAQERDVYHRLEILGVQSVSGHAVPILLHADDHLGVLEMTIVQPPFVLDFAGARLDERPTFPPDVMEEWFMAKQEEFGADWKQARLVLYEMERLGVYLLDVHPGNIRSSPTRRRESPS